MAAIRPSSDIRNKYNEISKFCHTQHKPVFLTKNGTGDLVVMSNEEYERLLSANELLRIIDEGLSVFNAGKTISVTDFLTEFERLKTAVKV